MKRLMNSGTGSQPAPAGLPMLYDRPGHRSWAGCPCHSPWHGRPGRGILGAIVGKVLCGSFLVLVLGSGVLRADISAVQIRSGATNPAKCNAGVGLGELKLFYNTAGKTYKQCSDTDTWTDLGMTDGAQTFGGVKTFTDGIVVGGSGVSNITPAAVPGSPVAGDFGILAGSPDTFWFFNDTAVQYVLTKPVDLFGSSPAALLVTKAAGADPTTNNCVKWVAGGGVGDAGAACGGGGTTPDPTKFVPASTDFLWNGATSTALIAPWFAAAAVSGTSTAVTGTANHPGIVTLTSSTSANSGYAYALGTSSFLLAGTEVTEFIFQVVTTANTTARLGFQDSNSSTAPTDGAWVNIAATTLDGRTASNTTSSTSGTNYTITASVWYRAKVVVNSDATQVDFYLYTCANGVQV